MASQEVAGRIGAAIARHRNQIGFSQEELDFRAGLHRTAVGQLERGERVPRADTIIRLAACLEIPAGDLLIDVQWEPIAYRAGGYRFSEESSR